MSTFRAFPQFEQPTLRRHARSRHRVGPHAEEIFPGDRPWDRLARALGRHRAISYKELLESAEFFLRVRRRVRAAHVADLCCGHGLTGLLFAAWERRVERVTLLDRTRPRSHDALLDAIAEIAPWVRDKVVYHVARVERAATLLPPGTSVVAVHACGVRTDRCLDAGLAVGGALAVMPCCYFRTAQDAPRAIRDAAGAALATDIHRTYRLEAAGRRVDWSEVPEAITPMNRILVAWCPPGSAPISRR